MQRLFIGTIILGIILWFTPWIGLLFATLYSFFNQKPYYEIILFGVLIDVIYQSIIVLSLLQIPVYTFISIGLYWLTSHVKKRMNVYA